MLELKCASSNGHIRWEKMPMWVGLGNCLAFVGGHLYVPTFGVEMKVCKWKAAFTSEARGLCRTTVVLPDVWTMRTREP
jgi:hypothetical protein